MSRICIYPKDIQVLLGKSERQARRIHKNIKQHFGKTETSLLTIEEFCQYFGLKEDKVKSQIR